MPEKRLVIAIGLLFPLAACAYGGYASIMDAVLVEGGSNFVAPLVWFLGLLLFFSLGTMLWLDMTQRAIGATLMVLPSLFFSPTVVHVGIIIVASILIFGSTLKVRGELRERLHVSLRRSVWAGLSLALFALSLVISSQYYTHASALSWERLVPSFDLGEGTGAWMLRMLGTASPQLRSLEDKETSVDDFLLSLRQVKIRELSADLGEDVIETIRQAELNRSKSELSRLLGRTVSGDEKMNTILSEVIRKKTVAFLSGGVQPDSMPVPLLPFFLAILLFFTVYPIGSVIAPFAVGLAGLIFALLVRTKLVAIRTMSAEQEAIV